MRDEATLEMMAVHCTRASCHTQWAYIQSSLNNLLLLPSACVVDHDVAVRLAQRTATDNREILAPLMEAFPLLHVNLPPDGARLHQIIESLLVAASGFSLYTQCLYV